MHTLLIDFDLEEFEPWSGAISTKERIVDEGKADQFSAVINELYPEGIEDVKINDILWFDSEWCYEMVGITDEDEE